MRISSRRVIAAGAVLFASVTPSLAIEGLQISVQCPDVILGWPSAPGENYIVQWRPTLAPTTPWVTLTNSLPADWTTNWTFFVDSNRVQCASGGGGGGGGEGTNSPPPVPNFAVVATSAAQASEPLAMPADGSGSAVPLCLYPPGFDLSGLIILDPSTGEWVSGSGCTIPQPSMNRRLRNSPQPLDDSPGDNGSPPDPGFYRVVRNGASIWALTNGTILSGVVALPVEVGNDGGTLETVTLQANYTSIPGVEPLEPPFSLLSFGLDTTRLNNGDNFLVVEAIWNMNTNTDLEADDWPDFVKLQSVPVQVVVSNEISYPNWLDEFGGNSVSFDVVSIYPDADWQMDLYDSQTNYVGSFTGHTTDGNIHVDWGVTNSLGTPLTDNVFYSATTVTYASGGGTASVHKPNPAKFRGTDNYPPLGQWIVAWQNIFEDNPEQYKNQPPPMPNMLNSVFAAYAAAQSGGSMIQPLPSLPGSFQPLRFGTNGTTVQKSQDWAQFKIALTNLNARNLYYFGHGAPDKLGGTKDPNRALTSGEVGTLLHYNDSNPTNRHFFRYVFLDGCETANGSFPSRFGIPKTENMQIDDFQHNGLRPRAFSGWSDYKKFSALEQIPWQFPGYRINFWAYWFLNNFSLWQAHEQARRDSVGTGFAIGQNLKIYGAYALHFYDYNQ